MTTETGTMSPLVGTTPTSGTVTIGGIARLTTIAAAAIATAMTAGGKGPPEAMLGQSSLHLSKVEVMDRM